MEAQTQDAKLPTLNTKLQTGFNSPGRVTRLWPVAGNECQVLAPCDSRGAQRPLASTQNSKLGSTTRGASRAFASWQGTIADC